MPRLNHYRRWSPEDRAELLRLHRQGLSLERIAAKLQRTVAACHNQRAELLRMERARWEESKTVRERLANLQGSHCTEEVVWSRSYFWGLFKIEKIRCHAPGRAER